jgi:hypothetical protein
LEGWERVTDVLDELRSYAESHAALKAGYGRTDDILGFIRWYRAKERGSLSKNDSP